MQPMPGTGSAGRNGPSFGERSLVANRGAQVADQREQPRPDFAFEQVGPKLKSGPAATDDHGLGSVSGIKRRGHGVDVSAPVAQREAEAVLLVLAKGLLETPPRQRPFIRTPLAQLLQDGITLG